MKEQPKISLIELTATQFGDPDAPAIIGAYDAVAIVPPRATRELESVLRAAGYQNVTCVTPRYNNPVGKLTERDWKEMLRSNYALFSPLTRTASQSQRVAEKIREMNPEIKIGVGGYHATFCPEECLEWADFVVIREGDVTCPEVITAYEQYGSPEGVKGVVYKEKDKIIYNEHREFLTEEKLSELPLPVYDKQTNAGWNIDVLHSSRGCPFDCDFCSVCSFYERRYRRFSNESTVNKILQSNNYKPGGLIMMGDDNFAVDIDETKELLDMVVSERKKGRIQNRFLGQFRVEAGLDDDLLRRMKQAGFVFVYLGIEGVTQAVLDGYNKKLKIETINEAVKNFAKYFWVHGMFVLGEDHDTPETIKETLTWAARNVDSAQFSALTAFPGTKFRKCMEAQGRLLPVEDYCCDGSKVVVEPKNFTASGLQDGIVDTHQKFYGWHGFRRMIAGRSLGPTGPFREWLGKKVLFSMYSGKIQAAITKILQEPEVKKHREDLVRLDHNKS